MQNVIVTCCGMQMHAAIVRTVYISYNLMCGPQPLAEKGRAGRPPLAPRPSAIRSSAHVYLFTFVLVLYTVALLFKEVLALTSILLQA